MVDYTRIGASLENRVAEYVDHLHEHFEHPVVINDGHYMPPTAPGYSITMKPASLAEFRFPDGPVWSSRV
jgi:L-fuconate dehydratase